MKKLLRIFLCVLAVILCATASLAHSGRTDSSGGHKDNKNKSGLGSYHYHCGGHPAHLHPNGVCPYATSSTTTTKETEAETKAPSKPTSVSISAGKTELRIGEKTELYAYVYPSDADDNSVYISSSDESVVDFINNKLQAIGEGTAIITGETYNGKKDTITITVKKVYPEKITLSVTGKQSDVVYVGDALKYSATISPSDADDKTVKWVSTDEAVATVDSYGNVTTHMAGDTDIKAIATNGVVGAMYLVVYDVETEPETAPLETVPAETDPETEVALPETEQETKQETQQETELETETESESIKLELPTETETAQESQEQEKGNSGVSPVQSVAIGGISAAVVLGISALIKKKS